MRTILRFDKFFIYSETKCFRADFGNRINVITGKNTSGKSTLLQSLLYTIGINDVRHNLYEILNVGVIFRLDCTLTEKNVERKLVFIRDNSILVIKDGNKTLRFNGIDSDSSVEHIKLKDFLRRLLGFDLILESKGELKDAPIETMFLPYYISQSVGWVYLRKSFSNLDYYKNFKDDYLDFYLGIIKPSDRVKRSQLEKELQNVRIELSFYETMKTEDVELSSSELNDEDFVNEAQEYLIKYNENKAELKKVEKKHTNACNKLSLLEQRQSVLMKVGAGQKKQSPIDGECPTCHRTFDFKLDEFYEYQQSLNDTNKQKEDYKRQIIDTQSLVNSLMKKIVNLRNEIEKMYATLKEYQKSDIKFSDWIDNKASVKLGVKIQTKVRELMETEENLVELIKAYKTDEEVMSARVKKEKAFKKLFTSNIESMKVKHLEGERYNNLYRISSFPSQGVELHKTVMSYHFAFNSLVSETSDIHRLPFILDAVFKEDIEKDNRDLIYSFLKNNSPQDTQTVFSVAFTKTNSEAIEDMKTKLGKDVTIIVIGDLSHKRSLLFYDIEMYQDVVDETNELLIEL